MLKKRIIPCLDVKNGRCVKGINFVDLRDAGDPVELAGIYSENLADELVFLDITATNEGRKTFASLVNRIADNIDIPFTVGGGISSVEDVAVLLDNGADKISINSVAVENPELITDLADRFGSQCVVCAIDVKYNGAYYEVVTHGGQRRTGLDVFSWARKVNDMGAGEILLTSMDCDGTKQGFDIEVTKGVCDLVSIPVIASGGAGNMEHFFDVFDRAGADAALAASIFHFHEVDIPELKDYLASRNVPVRRREDIL